MNDVRCLQPEEVINRMQLSDSGYRTMLAPEQRSVTLLEDILCKFTKPEDLGLDVYCVKIATVPACSLMQQHRRYVG